MTYEEIEQLVANGTWTKETLAAQPANSMAAVGSGATLSKNINKFAYFAIEIAHNESTVTGDAMNQTMTVIVNSHGEYLFHRDYINNWKVEHECIMGGTYTIQGNFGEDGSKIYITGRTVPEDDYYEGSFYIKGVYGYRPTRKIIYVYNKDTNTYLVTSDNDYLYTSNDLRLATKEVTE